MPKNTALKSIFAKAKGRFIRLINLPFYFYSIYCFYFTFKGLNSIWARITAINIKTQPIISLPLITSPKRAPESTAKTDSKLITTEATVGLVSFCATI